MKLHFAVVAPLLAGVLACVPAFGDGTEEQPWDRISDALLPLSLAATGYELLQDDPYGRETGRRMADTMIITTGTVLLTKDVVHSRRPRPSTEVDGFPSGHTAYAFALAEAVGAREPKARPWLYVYAAAVGWSRVELNRHDWDQVIGGAVLGYLIGHQTGRGRWRLLGHRDEQATLADRGRLSLGASSGFGARYDFSF
ncbi:MAG: phosphatase PAP2 family protein [Armatimonadetes bacterium]|nr:phosphatase PAP2 family protein [Armatimonadota bacterium]